jgi:hypothetical protein
MPPKKTAATRKSTRRGRTSERVTSETPPSSTTPDFGQLFAEHMAASMPELVAQIRDGVLQSLGGRTPSARHSGDTGGTGGGEGSARVTIERDDVPRREVSLKSFMSCKPPEFRGTEGAVATLQWMEKIESIFETVGCIGENRVRFAAFVF